MSLTEKAMIARVNIKGPWNAAGEDEAESLAIARRKGISEDVYRAIKKLLDPKRVPTLKAFTSARSTMRTKHRQMTLAWEEKGGRLLPVTMYFDYMQEMGTLKQKVEDTYRDFCNDIPSLKLQFQTDPSTANAYREEDWPDPAELIAKFEVRLRITPLADADHFLCKIGEEEERRIKEDCSKDIYGKVVGGLAELVSDLKKVVEESLASIAKYETDSQGKVLHTFKDTAVLNVRKITATARKLNVLNDPTLNQLLDQIDANLGRKDPQVLRDNYVQRKQVVADAGDMVKKLAQIESALFRAAEAA